MAQTVNPYDIDDIGQAVLKALDDNISQPKLRKHIESTYNVSSCTDLLIDYYTKLL